MAKNTAVLKRGLDTDARDEQRGGDIEVEKRKRTDRNNGMDDTNKESEQSSNTPEMNDNDLTENANANANENENEDETKNGNGKENENINMNDTNGNDNENEKEYDGLSEQQENDDSDASNNSNGKKKPKGKLFQCTGYPGCSMVFTRSEHLARHIRKHTGERPFECDTCKKKFSRLDNLRQHKQTVHSYDIDRSFKVMKTNATNGVKKLRRGDEPITPSVISQFNVISSPPDSVSPNIKNNNRLPPPPPRQPIFLQKHESFSDARGVNQNKPMPLIIDGPNNNNEGIRIITPTTGDGTMIDLNSPGTSRLDQLKLQLHNGTSPIVSPSIGTFGGPRTMMNSMGPINQMNMGMNSNNISESSSPYGLTFGPSAISITPTNNSFEFQRHANQYAASPVYYQRMSLSMYQMNNTPTQTIHRLRSGSISQRVGKDANKNTIEEEKNGGEDEGKAYNPQSAPNGENYSSSYMPYIPINQMNVLTPINQYMPVGQNIGSPVAQMNHGHPMGQMGQMGQMGPINHLNQINHMGQLNNNHNHNHNHSGQLNPLHQVGQMYHQQPMNPIGYGSYGPYGYQITPNRMSFSQGLGLNTPNDYTSTTASTSTSTHASTSSAPAQASVSVPIPASTASNTTTTSTHASISTASDKNTPSAATTFTTASTVDSDKNTNNNANNGLSTLVTASLHEYAKQNAPSIPPLPQKHLSGTPDTVTSTTHTIDAATAATAGEEPRESVPGNNRLLLENILNG